MRLKSHKYHIRNLTVFLLMLAIVLSNISQIPLLLDNSLIKMSYMVIWILLFIVLLFVNRFRLNIKCVLLPIVFDLFCLVGSLFGKTYLLSPFFRIVNMAAFIMLIGLLLGQYNSISLLRKISLAYIISSLVVGVTIYYTSFAGVDWAGASIYLYKSKNSAAAFLLVGLILTITMFYTKHRLLSLSIIIIYVSLILMMKSRATILSLVVFLLYFVTKVVVSRKERMLYIAVIVMFILLVVFHPAVNQFIIQDIMLNNRSMAMDELTSGRSSHWLLFAKNFDDHFLVGTGGTWLESMPLAVLYSFGLLGGVPILLFSIMPLIYSLKRVSVEKSTIVILVVSISLVMLVNGLFEEQAPFGPGVKCYSLWLFSGLLIAENYKNKNNESKELYNGK